MTSEDQNIDTDDAIDNPFKEEPGITDVALIVEGEKIFVNKALLCIASPVFKAMFQSDFKEKHCAEVELPGKSFEDVVDFLKLMYPNMYRPLDFETVIRLLPLLHEYCCQRQMEECQRFIVQHINPDKGDIDLDILLQCMQLSDMCELQDALNNCIEQGARHSLSLLTKNDFFHKVPVHVKEKLYFKRLILFENSCNDLVTDILRNCDRCKKEMEYKKLGLLLDTTITGNWSLKFKFQIKSTTPKEDIEIKTV